MIRGLLIAAAITAAAVGGSAISTTPLTIADPANINCTQFNDGGSCFYANCTAAHAVYQAV
jgi:uncharacterized RmlC-like cupin family protein